jgi:hypothetical protein
MRSLRTLRLAGNEWAAPLDPDWGVPANSSWAASLKVLDLSSNPLSAGDVPQTWLGMGNLTELYVSHSL